MRPLKLKMLNFGPYKNETVDFTQFENVPLFLISGKTGSGKTTIFDGLCYALFGETSGNERTPQQMRSLFANGRDKTVVKLSFEHQGKIYRITREPQYNYTNSKGGTSLHQAKQLLEYEDISGEPVILNKKKDIQCFIEDLLHLNVKQFTQIVLLPQQQFRKFLAADSSEKETVLRQVFGTEIFEKWTNRIKEHVSQLQKQNNQRFEHLKTLMQTVTLNDELAKNVQNVSDWLDVIDKQIKTNSKFIHDQRTIMTTKKKKLEQQRKTLIQAQRLQKAFEEQHDLEQQMVELTRQEPEIIQTNALIHQLEWTQQQQTLILQISQQRSELTKNHQRVKDVDQNLSMLEKQDHLQQKIHDDLKDQESEIVNLKNQVQQLEPKLDLYNKIQDDQSRCLNEQKQLDRVTQNVTQLNAMVEEKNELLSHIQERLQSIGDLTDANEKLAQTQLRLNRLEERNKRLEQARENLKRIKQQLKTVQQVYDEKKKDKDQLSMNAEKLQNYYAQNQINFYVKQLAPGKACPICGSTKHPHPTEIQVPEEMRSVNEGDVQQAQSQYTNAAQQLAQVEEQVKALLQRKQELQQDIDSIIINIERDNQVQLDSKKIPSFLKEMKRKFNDQKDDFDHLKSEQKRLNEQQNELRRAIQQMQQRLNGQQEQKFQIEQNVTTINTQIKMQRRLLPNQFSTREELLLQLNSWKKHILEFEDAQRQNDDVIQQISNKQIMFETQKKQLVERLSELQQEFQLNEQELNARLSKADLTESQLQRLTNKLPLLDQLRNKVEDFYQRQHSNQDQLSKVKKIIGNQKKPEINALQQVVSDKDSELQQLQICLGQKLSNLQNLKSTRNKVLKVWQECQKEKVNLDEIIELSQVVSGKTKENKLGFERFVLREYFKEVLDVANQVLDRITAGRYSFVLQKNAERNTAKQTGLGIDVYDDEAGKMRSAHTLSGGESFIAALSLALALGEVIQRQNGGTEIDTLFIDEGFGSLDEDSLEVAMETLQTLESDQRMIGIISHVQELHAQIPDQINVISVNGQSRLKYCHEL